MRRFVLVCAALLVLVMCILGAMQLISRSSSALENDCKRISDWGRASSLAVGLHVNCAIPASLGAPSTSQVNLLKTAAGDVVVLLKTSVGWKGNYDGVIYSTKAISAANITANSYGREQFEIPTIDASPPVVSERVNSHFLLVYFDLY